MIYCASEHFFSETDCDRNNLPLPRTKLLTVQKITVPAL